MARRTRTFALLGLLALMFSSSAGAAPGPLDPVICLVNGVTSAGLDADCDGDGFTPAQGDCDDADPATKPGVPDDPDLQMIDRNCDGIDGEELRSIFVSPSGNDADPGTKAQPKATIAAGMVAAGVRKDVLIAEGTYPALTLRSYARLFGGYSATDWSRSASTPTVVEAAGTAMVGDGVSDVIVQLVTAHALTPATPGASAYGVRLINGSQVVLEGVTILAEPGAPGSMGTAGFVGGVGANGGSGGAGACSGSTGGSPGTGASGAGSGGFGGYGNQNGTAGGSATGGAGGGAGGAWGDPGTPGAPGKNGAAGSPGSPGGGGANDDGAAGTTWTGRSGSAGGTGTSGLGGGGGGGGGGYYAGGGFFKGRGSGGGGGGGGGKPGGGSGGGSSGGGSFGVYLWVSTIELRGSDVTASRGGTGGSGGKAGPGGPGGTGGAGPDPCPGQTGAGGAGGNGGSGGAGGGGGGGAGGPSVGVYLGSTSSVTHSGTSIGHAAGGAGGSGGGGASGSPGQPGQSATIW